MQVRLLGPVDVIVNGEPRPVPGLRRKSVLAVLALHHGQVVSTGQLAEVVWGDSAPATAHGTLQSHISYLRGVLGRPAAIRAEPPGYVLHLADGTDVQRAEQLLRDGRQAADPVHARRHLAAALALWRGRPLADVSARPGLAEQAERLELLRVEVIRAWAQARLAAGEHGELVAELEQLAAERPLDEQLQAQLMLAMYRSGRQADALATYQRLRRALNEELGVDPGKPARGLELAILRQDPALDGPAGPAGPAPAAARVPVPAQLPAPVPALAGRRAELARLNALLPRARPGAPGSPSAVAVLSGTAGVGKTALAVSWAHGVSAQFPDGQLYVNLRGFDPEAAVEPGDAVRGFLEALGVPAARMPAGLADRAGLYRSLLAGQRVLVVLDNARDAGQVRPLLPASPGCLAIVTSRDHLAGLVAAEGARPLALDLLSVAEARDLLAGRLGTARLAGEPAAVDDIIAGCARLPLALTVASARAATAPGFPLAVIAAELRAASRALDPFQGSDSATDVRSVFSWSYRALGAGAASLFRLLGLHPGPDISLAAAASLAGIGPDQARQLLAGLVRAHLLTEEAPGRYAFHDLLRAYAAEQAAAWDSPPARAAAVDRVLDHYLHTAHRAALLIEPHLDPLALIPARPGVMLAGPDTAESAMTWFAAEHAALLAAVRLAAQAGSGGRAWQLAWTLGTFLLRCGSWADNALAQEAGLAAARRAGDASGAAHAIERLALGQARSGHFDDAVPSFERALAQFEAVGDLASQALIHNSLTWIAERQERLADALGHATLSLRLYRAAGHPGQAMVLNDLGFCHARLGHYEQAMSYCEQALAAVRELGERSWEAATWDSLGFIHRQLGDHERAAGCYQQALGLYADLADRFNEADTLVSLGDLQQGAGDTGTARGTWTRALRIFDELGHPDGDAVLARLRGAERQPAPGPAGEPA